MKFFLSGLFVFLYSLLLCFSVFPIYSHADAHEYLMNYVHFQIEECKITNVGWKLDIVFINTGKEDIAFGSSAAAFKKTEMMEYLYGVYATSASGKCIAYFPPEQIGLLHIKKGRNKFTLLLNDKLEEIKSNDKVKSLYFSFPYFKIGKCEFFGMFDKEGFIFQQIRKPEKILVTFDESTHAVYFIS